MDKVAIIGIHSFSGSTLAKHLLENGTQVIGFARSLETPSCFLPHRQIPQELLSKLKVYQSNLLYQYKEISNEIMRNGAEVVVNFAAQSMVSESWETPEDWYETNVTCLAKLVAGLLNSGTYNLKKFVHFTTPEVYGSTAGKFQENWQLNPTTPYAISRAASDFHLKAMFNTFNFPVIFTRTANIYGSHQKLYRVIPKLIIKALKSEVFQLHGGGKSLRSFIHSSDVASALIAVLDEGKPGETYHISTRDYITVLDLTKRILNLLNIDFESIVEVVEDRPGKDQAYLLDSSKIREDLGWSDQIPLDEGLEEVINWVKKEWKNLANLSLEYTHSR